MPCIHVAVEGDKPSARLVMVGGHEALGWWDPRKGAALEWNGKAWETSEPVVLSGLSGHLDYKFVRVGEGSPQWERGRNRVLEVPTIAHGERPGFGCEMTISAMFSGTATSRCNSPRDTPDHMEDPWCTKFQEATCNLAALREQVEEEIRRWSEEDRQAQENEAALRRELAQVRKELDSLAPAAAAYAAAPAPKAEPKAESKPRSAKREKASEPARPLSPQIAAPILAQRTSSGSTSIQELADLLADPKSARPSLQPRAAGGHFKGGRLPTRTAASATVSLAAALAAKATGGDGASTPRGASLEAAAAATRTPVPRSPIKAAPHSPSLLGDNHRGEERKSGTRSVERSPSKRTVERSPLADMGRATAAAVNLESGILGELAGSQEAKEEAYRAVSRLAAHQAASRGQPVDTKPATRLKGGRRAGFEPAWPDKLKGNAPAATRGPQLKGNFNPPRRLSRGLTSKFIAEQIRGGSPTRKRPDRQRTLMSTASSTPGGLSTKGRSPAPHKAAEMSDGGSTTISTTMNSRREFSRDPSSSQESEMQGLSTPGGNTPTTTSGSLLRSSPLSRQGQQSRLSRGPLGKYLDASRSLPDVIISMPATNCGSVSSDLHQLGGGEAQTEPENSRVVSPREFGSPSWDMLPCPNCLQRFDTQRALDAHTRFVHGATPIF